MQTRKDPFEELKTQFFNIRAKKSEAINFLENRVQKNTDLLQSIRPNKIHGSGIVERVSFYAIPRAMFVIKTAVAGSLGVAVAAAAVTVLLPITTTLLCFKQGKQAVNDVVKSLTPELKEWKIPGAELRGGGIRGLKNQSSIFNQPQNDQEGNKIVSGNLTKIKILSTTERAEYRGFNADISKLNELSSSPLNKSDEIKKLESKTEINKEQIRIEYLICELQKSRSQEIELIKGNLKRGDTLVVKDLPVDGDQKIVKTQEFKRASSIGNAIKGSFSFSASRNLAKDDDRKLKQTQSLSSLKEVDGSSTQSLFFSSIKRTTKEVKEIQEGISKIDEGYKKEIDKLMQANRDLNIQAANLEKNIREYKESIQKEKNVNDLKSLLNSNELNKEDILKKYDEIIGNTPATSLRPNSFQSMRGDGPILFRSNSNLPASADLSQNKNKNDSLSMLNDGEKVKLEGIIDERMRENKSLQIALPAGSALAAAMRSMGARVMTL